MKVYISADIEGISGITSWDEAMPTGPDYGPWRKRMVAEVQAVVRGARSAGATEIWVQDAHASARNLRPDELPDVHLVRGWSGHPAMMVQALDSTFAALLCAGYHSPALSAAHPLAHTLCGGFAEVRVDGVLFSEFGLAATLADTLGVPTRFLSGDAALCEAEAAARPGLVTVPVHRGVGPSTWSRPLDGILAELEASARAACLSPLASATPQGPWELTVRFKLPAHAYGAAFYPGARLMCDDTVALDAKTWLDILTPLKFWLHLTA
jgi:D-amino peptidase